MLSLTGWLDGMSALGYTIFGCTFGLLIIYKSRKLNAPLLTYMGLTIFFAGLLILGPCTDFLTIILTGNNIDNTYALIGILSGIAAPPATIFGIYVGAELLTPNKKWYIVSIYSILGIIFLLFLFIDPWGSFSFTYPNNPGEDIIDTQIVYGSPLFLISITFLFSLLIFNGLGYLLKSIQSTGMIRKKFFFLSIGYLLYVTCFILETYISPGIALVFIRICLILSFWLWYFGLKEETVSEREEIKFARKKRLKLRNIDARIVFIESLSKSRPMEISSEEISFYREQKMCLICRGKLGRFNVYTCPKCDVLYCKKCVEALINLENACWVCNAAFDDSKPSKPFERAEEITIEGVGDLEEETTEELIKPHKNKKKNE